MSDQELRILESSKVYIVNCYKNRKQNYAQVFTDFREAFIHVAMWLKETDHQIVITRDGEICLCEVFDNLGKNEPRVFGNDPTGYQNLRNGVNN